MLDIDTTIVSGMSDEACRRALAAVLATGQRPTFGEGGSLRGEGHGDPLEWRVAPSGGFWAAVVEEDGSFISAFAEPAGLPEVQDEAGWVTPAQRDRLVTLLLEVTGDDGELGDDLDLEEVDLEEWLDD